MLCVCLCVSVSLIPSLLGLEPGSEGCFVPTAVTVSTSPALPQALCYTSNLRHWQCAFYCYVIVIIITDSALQGPEPLLLPWGVRSAHD